MIKEAAERREAKRTKLNPEKNVRSGKQNADIDFGTTFATPPQLLAPKKAGEKTNGGKLLKFRKRLPHVPPEDKDFDWDYTNYACYGDV